MPLPGERGSEERAKARRDRAIQAGHQKAQQEAQAAKKAGGGQAKAGPGRAAGGFLSEADRLREAGGYRNQAGTQPDMRYAIDAMRGMTEGDMGAKRATEGALQSIKEFGIGQEAASRDAAAMRGATGTGAEDFLHRSDAEARRREAGKVTEDISLSRADKRDELLRTILGGGQAAGTLAQGDRQLALNQQIALDQNARAAEQATAAREMAMLQMLMGGLA